MDWKKTERISAGLMGGERIPITGRCRGSAPDHTSGSGLWAVELKARSKVPAWITYAMGQAVASKHQGAGEFPIVILHPKGKRYADDLMFLRRSDLMQIETELLDARAHRA